MILKDRFDSKWKSWTHGCWLWTGGTEFNSSGIPYGYFFLDAKKKRRAHRASWIIYRGEIEKSLVIRHLCNNSLCVNPDHLAKGTQKENIVDKYIHGTMDRTYGNNNKRGYQKLTEKDVLYIRKSNETQIELAKKFGVCQSAISRAKNKSNWGWL